MAYTALYRKYRPAKFSDVLGQEHIVRTLINQLVSGKVSHAYLFCGTRGTGKTSLAKIFAKAINCLSPSEGEPCGKCAICVGIENGRSLNVIEIDAASNNGVEHIRDIRDEVRYTPAEGKFKVYIIDEVHMLSASAYNAFLKTLEEPPAHVVFILATTDPQKIPATIHSRCQRYDFKRISQKLVEERLTECLLLEGVEADSDAARYIAKLSDGSMRDALSLAERCVSFFAGERITLNKVLEITGGVDSKCFLELTECLNSMDSAGALAIVDGIVKDGRDIGQIIFEALSYFRNILIARTVEKPAAILDISEEAAQALRRQGQKTEEPRIMSYISSFSELQAHSKSPYSLNQRVLLEIALIRLCNPEIVNGGYEEICNKLIALEKRIESGSSVSHERGKKLAKSEQEEPEKPVVKKILIPGDLNEAKERFGEVINSLLAEREGHILGSLLKRTTLGFLDNKSLYVIFEDEANENVLKESPKKLEMLKNTLEDVTGKAYDIKTITKQQFKRESNHIEIIVGETKNENFLKSVKTVFEDFEQEE